MNNTGCYQQTVPQSHPPNQHVAYQQISQPQQTHPEAYLCDAFPNIDRSTVSAIWASTRGDTDSAHRALLAISGLQAQPSFPQPAPSQYLTPGSNYEYPAPSLSPGLSQPLQHQPSTDYLQPRAPPPSPYYHEHGPPTTPETHPNHLTPAPSAPSPYSRSTTPNPPPQAGSVTPMYPPASPYLHPALSAPSQLQAHSSSSLQVPDMSQLSLNPTSSDDKAAVHWAACDGCSVDPIKGTRWNCLACADYDLCNECKMHGIHNHHRLEQLRPGLEVHLDVACDGCKVSAKQLLGVRYACLKHDNEDWCEKCISNGTACGGPYKEHRQTELGRQIEENGCLPMPQNWIPFLRPAVATYNVEDCPNASNWLQWPPGLAWFNKPKRERRKRNADPVYKVEMKQVKGHVISDHKNSWTMKNAAGTKLYTYTMEQDRKTHAVKSERFGEYKGRCTAPVWKHGPQMDSLSFEDLNTRAQYVWLSNRPISTLNNERFDFQRNALFQKKGGKETLVADFTWWDGLEDPEDCLTIRDPHIDHAFVIASLCMVHDHHWQIMNEENERDPDSVFDTQTTARLTLRGRLTYWHLTDYQESSSSTSGRKGSSTTAKLHTITHSLNAGVELGNAVASVITASNGGGGGS